MEGLASPQGGSESNTTGKNRPARRRASPSRRYRRRSLALPQVRRVASMSGCATVTVAAG